MNATIFLRFPDEPSYLGTLPAGFEQLGETGSPLPEGVSAMSVIGVIEQGDPPVALPGWHVNMLGTVPNAWAPYVIAAPATPVRIFGGDA